MDKISLFSTLSIKYDLCRCEIPNKIYIFELKLQRYVNI